MIPDSPTGTGLLPTKRGHFHWGGHRKHVASSRSNCIRVDVKSEICQATRWAPTTFKWRYIITPINGLSQWVTGVITSVSGVILFITGRVPTLY